MTDGDKVTIIIFSGDLDRVMAGFFLATSAASMGMEVTMFFTFWGLNVIKRDTKFFRGRGIMRKMLNIINRGGANRLPLSKFHMLGLGTWMMKKLMKESNIPSAEEMLKMSKELGVKIIACTTTMCVMGLSKDDFIPEIDSFAGASTYLAEAKDGRVNLFI